MTINHLGIIVDGNGRWAQKKGKSRSEGHKAGAENLEKLILYINEKKLVNYLSLYVFSTENFNRDKEEVNFLMNLFMQWFDKAKKKYQDNNIRVVFSSDFGLLDENIIDKIKVLEEKTKNNTGLVVNFCLSYGGRNEIVEASKKIANDYKNNKLKLEDLTEEMFNKYLYQDLPDMDFLIRTSGECRISNFMLWQLSYAEMYFPDIYFPDFTPKLLEEAIEVYKKRNRRFGRIEKN